MTFSFPDVQATDKYKNLRLKMDLEKKIYFQFHGITLTAFWPRWWQTSQPGSWHYMEGLTRLWTPKQDDSANPEIVYFLYISAFYLFLLLKQAFLKKPLLKTTLRHVCTSCYSIKSSHYKRPYKNYLKTKHWGLLGLLLGVSFDRNVD